MWVPIYVAATPRTPNTALIPHLKHIFGKNRMMISSYEFDIDDCQVGMPAFAYHWKGLRIELLFWKPDDVMKDEIIEY